MLHPSCAGQWQQRRFRVDCLAPARPRWFGMGARRQRAALRRSIHAIDPALPSEQLSGRQGRGCLSYADEYPHNADIKPNISQDINQRSGLGAAGCGACRGSARSSVRDPAGAAASSCRKAWPSRAECPTLPDGALFRLRLKRWRRMRTVATNVRLAQGAASAWAATSHKCSMVS